MNVYIYICTPPYTQRFWCWWCMCKFLYFSKMKWILQGTSPQLLWPVSWIIKRPTTKRTISVNAIRWTVWWMQCPSMFDFLWWCCFLANLNWLHSCCLVQLPIFLPDQYHWFHCWTNQPQPMHNIVFAAKRKMTWLFLVLKNWTTNLTIVNYRCLVNLPTTFDHLHPSIDSISYLIQWAIRSVAMLYLCIDRLRHGFDCRKGST